MTNEDLKKAENPCLKCSKLHRRAQKAEGEVVRLQARIKKLEAGLGRWCSPTRMKEAIERDRMAEVIESYR